MFGVQVNSFVDVCNYDDAKVHRVIASKMDIKDIMDVLPPQPVVPHASRNEAMHEMETNTDEDQDANSPKEQPTTHEDLHSLVRDPTTNLFLLGIDQMDTQETHVTVTPLKVPHAPVISCFGTPTSCVGFPSTASPSHVAGIIAKKDVELVTEAGCTTSSKGGSQQAKLPPMEGRDVLELILRPDISLYRENRRMRNKTPYNEYPKSAVLNLSNEDEDDIKMYNAISALPTRAWQGEKKANVRGRIG